jgi:hypothetical protein
MDRQHDNDPPQLDTAAPGWHGCQAYDAARFRSLWRSLSTLAGTAVIPCELVNGEGD